MFLDCERYTNQFHAEYVRTIARWVRYERCNAPNGQLYEHVPHEIGLCIAHNRDKDKNKSKYDQGNEHYFYYGCWGVD